MPGIELLVQLHAIFQKRVDVESMAVLVRLHAGTEKQQTGVLLAGTWVFLHILVTWHFPRYYSALNNAHLRS